MFLRHGLPAACALAVATLAAVAQEPPKPIGEIFASDASVQGAVQLAGTGMQVMSGSSVGAGQATALLRLKRGGEVRICPRTTLSMSSSHSGRDLMLGMNAGALEADYSLAASADVIVTPDFRILLAGPGKFHVAVGADARGNTCVRPLGNNAASVIVSELLGDGTYQVKPDEQVTFHNGKLADTEHGASDCGCPAAPPVMRAAVPDLPDLAELRKNRSSLPAMPLETPLPPPQAAPPAVAANEVHVQVDAPFVFRANQPEAVPLEMVAQLKVNAAAPWILIPQPPPAALPQAAVTSPPVVTRQAPPKKKFFGRIRAFFASIFH